MAKIRNERDPTVWLFSGPFSGNTKYLFLWIKQNRPDLHPFWVTNDSAFCAAAGGTGMAIVMEDSEAGGSVMKRAGVHLVENWGTRLRPILGGSRYVNLWHGSGFKAVGWHRSNASGSSQPPVDRERFVSWLERKTYDRPDIVVSSSGFQRQRLMDCFDLKEAQVPNLGCPRLDVHRDRDLRATAMSLASYASVESTFSNYAETYVYMPTWRDRSRDFFEEAIPDVDALAGALERRNAILYVKPHPHSARPNGVERENIRIWPENLDIYPVLWDVDCLITDYSSVMFDFLAYRNEGLILYPFDLDRYRTRDRELYTPFEEFVAGPVVERFGDLCASIRSGAAVGALVQAKVQRLRDVMFDGSMSGACARVSEYLLSERPQRDCATSKRGH